MNIRTSTLINRLKTIKTSDDIAVLLFDLSCNKIYRLDEDCAAEGSYFYLCPFDRANVLMLAVSATLLKENETTESEYMQAIKYALSFDDNPSPIRKSNLERVNAKG